MWIQDFIKKLFSGRQQEPIAPKKEQDWRDGLQPSPVDFRDVNANDHLVAMGVSMDVNAIPDMIVSPYVLTIKNQGAIPKCVGCATSTMKEFWARKQGVAIEFDDDWFYNECKKVDGLPYGFQGTTFRAAMWVLKNVGCMPKGGKPGDEKQYKIAGYVQVNCNFDDLRRAMWQYGAVLMGFKGSNSGWQTAYPRPPKPGEDIWGHATEGGNATKDYLKDQNSWGDQWGDKGYFYLPSTYLPFEAWAITVDMPITLLPDQNAKPKHQFTTTLVQGYNNNEVKVLQDCLKWLGCMAKDQNSTGLFGPVTVDAVKVFQGRYNISKTGNVGPVTIQKLNELFQ